MIYESKILVNCNEAIAWAALSADVDFVSHYPGSPVNFVEKHIKKLNDRFARNIKFNDSLNEHVAALSAAGASYCGARTMVVMKHVGLNIAADPFNYIGYTGVKGGMVIIVGTDPGANSSTGEEDVHSYVPQFNFPLFEPTSVQECYDFTAKAYELSEKYEIPVFIFVPGRLAYNVSEVEVALNKQETKADFSFIKDRAKYINVGAQAVKNHRLLLEKIAKIQETEFSGKLFFNDNATVGIITRGLSFSMTYELIVKHQLEGSVNLLNLDLVYPVNSDALLQFALGKSKVVVIEDQDGFVESQIKMQYFNELKCAVYGKNFFPKYGEITIEQIEDCLSEVFNISIDRRKAIEVPVVPERLGTFCEGCPHTGSFYSIDSVIKELGGIIGGDIGCSSLAPFRADWLLCMNAGIGVSQGMAQVLSNQSIISTGGDGSFFHAGALSLMSAVQNNIDLIHIVFDNSTIAMTGHQNSPSEDEFDHRKFLESMGVDRVIDVSPYDPKEFVNQLKDEMPKKGVRVFWAKGACVLKGNDFIEKRRGVIYPEIDPNKCGSCTKCYTELACPAIINLAEAPNQELKIDLERCVRCGVCHEICPNKAITIFDV